MGNYKGWFPLGLDCQGSLNDFLFLYLVLCAERARFAQKKINIETKIFSRYAGNLRLMKTSLERARRTHKLKLSALHEVNSLKMVVVMLVIPTVIAEQLC